ncbi:hypothetical protein ABZ671_00910 [Micromonospora sp. NPDC006766]|uniref:hypothetical protein n=1 Tax=Micromonospora sp. NPDC006766 TaxID=3154778 RepID=UPI0033C0CDA6
MGTTPTYGLRYQDVTDPPNGPLLGRNLAEDVEAQIKRIDAAKPPQSRRAYSVTTQTNIGTADVASLTLSGMVFKAGWAYRASVRGMVYGTTNAQVHFRLRKSNASGADWGEYGRVTCTGANPGNGAMVSGSLILLRSAGTDLTTDVALVVSASTGTCYVFAGATSPRYLLLEAVGPAADYIGLGVDVT